MFKNVALSSAIILGFLATVAHGHEYKAGNLTIHHPYARATPPNAPVSGGYMTIRNDGPTSDHLIGGSADFAGMIQIHEMKMDGDVMKMREIASGLEIPAGGEVELKPGGYHVMFMQLKEQLKDGEKRRAILRFERAGDVEVRFNIENVAAPAAMNTGHHAAEHVHEGDDKQQISALMKGHFDRADAPLTVEPVAVSGDWAVAGWIQEGRGGRGLLHRGNDGWTIHMCGGEAFRHADKLIQTGMPAADAEAIAAALQRGETALGAERIAQFDSFEGVVEIDANGHHDGKHQGHGG